MYDSYKSRDAASKTSLLNIRKKKETVNKIRPCMKWSIVPSVHINTGSTFGIVSWTKYFNPNPQLLLILTCLNTSNCIYLTDIYSWIIILCDNYCWMVILNCTLTWASLDYIQFLDLWERYTILVKLNYLDYKNYYWFIRYWYNVK
jgi:hypothetical protein